MADVSGFLLATDGWLYLKCVFCDGQARVVRPTADEVAQVATIWETGSYPTYIDTNDGRLTVLDNKRADQEIDLDDGLLTASDGDDVDAVGTMGWLPPAVDEYHAHRDEAPTNCKHIWFITATYGPAGEAAAELQCSWCREYATVLLTDDERETIEKALHMNLCLEWNLDRNRVILNSDEIAPPAVADLVNALDLFEGDDDDIPF